MEESIMMFKVTLSETHNREIFGYNYHQLVVNTFKVETYEDMVSLVRTLAANADVDSATARIEISKV